jgi:hypothetical protein
MDQEIQMRFASAAEIAARSFDRLVSLLERVETFALARWEEEKTKKADTVPLGRRKVADR